jgi:hypothetical protein
MYFDSSARVRFLVVLLSLAAPAAAHAASFTAKAVLDMMVQNIQGGFLQIGSIGGPPVPPVTKTVKGSPTITKEEKWATTPIENMAGTLIGLRFGAWLQGEASAKGDELGLSTAGQSDTLFIKNTSDTTISNFDLGLTLNVTLQAAAAAKDSASASLSQVLVMVTLPSGSSGSLWANGPFSAPCCGSPISAVRSFALQPQKTILFRVDPTMAGHAAVPEPSLLPLAGVAAAVLTATRRRTAMRSKRWGSEFRASP